MFTWIQTYLQKHFPVLLTVLLAILIVSFVFTIGNMPGFGGAGAGTEDQPFFGKNLAFAPERQLLEQKAQIHIMINYGQMVSQQEFIEDFASTRTGLLYLADELGIPAPDQDEFKEYIQEHRRFQGPDGYDEAAYAQFIMQVRAMRLNEKIITTVLEEDFRIEKVKELVFGPGYLAPHEALFQAKMSETSWQLDQATLDYESFNPDITITEEDVSQHYESNKESYRVPPRLKTKIVRFDEKDFLQEAATQTIDEQAITRQFSMRKSRYEMLADRPAPQMDEEGNELPLPEVTLDQVRDFVIRDLRMQAAKELARAAAEEFAYTLFDKNIDFESKQFNELIEKKGLTLEELAPMASDRITTQAGLNSSTLKQAFTLLNSSRYFSDPVENSGQYIVYFNNGTLESFIPESKDVRQQVVSEVTAEKKHEAFMEKGMELQTSLAEISDAEAFKAAAEQAGLSVTHFDPFKITDPVEGLDNAVRQTLPTLSASEVSHFIPTPTAGYFVFVAEKTIPDLSVIDEPVAKILESSQQIGTVSGGQAVQQMIIAARARTDWRVKEAN